MYCKVKDYMDANGVTITDKESGKTHYVPKNPDLYVYFVVDHAGDLLPSEEEKTLFMAIENLSSKYLMKMKNFYRVIPIMVQQQENVGDKVDTDYRGNTVEAKLSPSTAKLADNKTTAKRATQVISLFNPATYELETYKGYKNIRPIQDNFLYLHIHKNRRGPKNKGNGLWVNPVSKQFDEFPPANDVFGQNEFVAKKLGNLIPVRVANVFDFDNINSSNKVA